MSKPFLNVEIIYVFYVKADYCIELFMHHCVRSEDCKKVWMKAKKRFRT
jgi:hypothetical protein